MNTVRVFFLVLRYFSVSVFTLVYLFYTSASYAATQALCLCLVRPTFCAVGISFALHECTERLSMKFAAGNHYHQQINRLACLTYKLLTTGQPAAAAHARLLHHYTSTRTLRSTNQFFLDVPRFSAEFGKISFSYLAPTVWNVLPLNIKLSPTLDTFQRRLKTQLFK